MTQPEPLTEQQLDEIETRANAATKGPWGFYDGDTYADVAADLEMTGRGSYSARQMIARLEDENYWDDPAHEEHDEERAAEQMAANAAFVAAAREDVPALLAEIRRLRAELRIGSPWKCHVCGKDNHRDVCLICETDRPDPEDAAPAPPVAPLAASQPSEAPVEPDAATRPPTGRTGDSRRTLTPNEYDAAWHAVEGAAGDEGADPGTVLHAVLNRLGIEWQDAARPGATTEETAR